MSNVKYFNNVWGASRGSFILKNTKKECVLAVAKDQKDADLLYNELTLFNKNRRIIPFPEYTHEAFDEVRILTEIASFRSSALYGLIHNPENIIIVTTPYALLKKLPPKNIFIENILNIKKSDIISPDKLVKLLDKLGYLPVEIVTGPGEFCLRGGILDVYPINASEEDSSDYMINGPVRIEFFDDEIDDIFIYDIPSQKKTAGIENLTILPASEIIASENEIKSSNINKNLKDRFENFGRFAGHHWTASKLYNEPGTLFSYLSEDTEITVLEENWLSLIERTLISIGDRASETDFENPMDEFLSISEVERYFKSKELIIAGDFFAGERNSVNAKYRSIKSYFTFDKGNLYYALNKAMEEISALQHQMNRTVVAMESERFIKLLEDFSRDHELDIQEISSIHNIKNKENTLDHNIYLYKQRVSGGFISDKDRIVLVTDEDIFGFIRKRNKTVQKRTFDTAIGDLESGDFVVHIDYGIGVYQGLKHMEMGGILGDYLEIIYENEEKLYVPLEQISQIQKYIGAGDSKPRLSSLQTSTWSKLKASARKRAQEIAQDLLKLYAERKARQGFAFTAGAQALSEFEEKFPYDETEDQLAAILDVYKDMEAATPMERLVCGDVGFGKTEVAMRAACKAVLSGKQVAVLVPTTVLAQQHYHTFTKRFADLPVTIEYICRLRSAKEIRKIKEDLSLGKIDIIIGTHRLLSNDIQFNDLRLLIIDEEQRFGVAHKEKIAAMRTNIDCLSMSATPIPRTLQLSLSGIREISIIETPPSNRLPVAVKVLQNKDDIKRSMMKELERNGQIFFLHNRIENLSEIAAEIKKMIPHASVRYAHGRTPAKELEQILEDFYSGNLDVLVSTTIIENGIDIPNVNSIFINKAQNFGLSQLYQLKGRVGRGAVRGHCYLLVDDTSNLSPIARKRLSIIQQLSDLGSGLKIAMYDLQLRGAGDILGAAQSGFAIKIGYELFVKMISQAVQELQQGGQISAETDITTQFAYYIAADYIEDPRTRLDYYRMFNEIKNRYDMEELFLEISKQYGELKEETVNLGYIMLIKNMASSLKIQKAGIYPRMLRLTFTEASNVSFLLLTEIAEKMKIKFRFAGEYEMVLSFEQAEKTLELSSEFLSEILKTKSEN